MDIPLTKECLKDSINGESTASKKYLEYSKIADREGFKNISYLFYALSMAEKIHIRNHREALGGDDYEADIGTFTPGSTKENVQDAINGETYETKEMYPNHLKKIKKERKKEFASDVAALSMEWAKEVEKTHAEILTEALEALEDGHDFEIEELYICKFCGNLVYTLPEKFCPVCKHDVRFYKQIPRKEVLK